MCAQSKAHAAPRSVIRRTLRLAAAIAASTMLFATASVFALATGGAGVEAARAHAAQYADPNYYTQPAVVDIYQDIFLGRPTAQTNPSYNTGDASSSYAAERQTVACYAGDCAPPSPGRAEICAGAYYGSFLMIGAGDTFYVGPIGVDWMVAGHTPDATRVKTHTVLQIRPGTGDSDCAVGTWILTVSPWIDYVAEGVTSGASLSPVWRDSLHPTGGAAYLIGYKLGSDTRDTWGAQGHSGIFNPGFAGAANGVVAGWTVTTGAIQSAPYDTGSSSTMPSPGGFCNSGEGVDCVVTVAAEGTELVETDPVSVIPGETYILSGLMSSVSAGASWGLADDRDGDGLWTLSPDLTASVASSEAMRTMGVVPRWFSTVVTIPGGVPSVKFVYRSRSSNEWIDFVSARRQTGHADSRVSTNFLMNDPGTRNVVFMGDSWFDPRGQTPCVPYFKQGLLDAFAARGISIPPEHVVLAGFGGNATSDILSRLPNVLATYRPLYIVFDGGINDTRQDTPPAETLANFKEMARLSVQAGAIPIFLSPPPAVELHATPLFGTGSVFAALHTLRESLRNCVFGFDADWCGTPGEVPILTCGVGACARATQTCVSGVLQACTPGAPTTESCNGIDDDCDGVIDDGGDLCDDGSSCTADRCDPTVGCVHASADMDTNDFSAHRVDGRDLEVFANAWDTCPTDPPPTSYNPAADLDPSNPCIEMGDFHQFMSAFGHTCP